ncbi:glutaredoxin [Thaumasiovibrio subtropicus]|uniref:glutaredoxin n=1 Tax=Thaumasiovibrio subtropicus TaxID=1891207 RepID=UPI000B34D2D1|nr:glutaredoxin [Thaumasiovibrio subtropicus]
MKIEMFSKDNCTQCIAAAHWLAQQGHQVETLKLSVDFDNQTLFTLFPNARTYPQFRLNGDTIGDFSTLKSHLAFVTEAEF